MRHRRPIIVIVSLLLSVAGAAWAQEAHPEGRNVADSKFMKFPTFPTCAPGAVQNGDPTKGPSVILAKASAGCVVPWHWHTPNEHLMMVKGTARLETRDGKPFTLRAGGYAMMPSHHVHRFTCTTACLMYVYSDTAFDIHYVDKDGTEMTPEAALKAVGEKTIKP